MLPPKDAHVLMPRTCEYVVLPEVADGIEVGNPGLKQGDYTAVSEQAQCNHKGS